MSVRYYEINIIKYIDIQNTNWFLLILPSLFHLLFHLIGICIYMPVHYYEINTIKNIYIQNTNCYCALLLALLIVDVYIPNYIF